MLKAVLKNGVIQPLEPLPADWTEGVELEVCQATVTPSPQAVEEWLAEMNALCADSTPEQEAQLQAALDELKRASKGLARRQMGLAG